MSLLTLLVTIVALATLALSASVPGKSAEQPTDSNVETFDSYTVGNLPEKLPLTIQLPREEPGVPFYPAQPVPYLRAPQEISNHQPNFYQGPVPSEYLTAPTEGAWNPNDDPTFYYELPASITKENVPTNQYPKKYNKDIHSKRKPLATAPKQEIALEPINELQYLQKQKELYNTVQKLNKKENQKFVKQEKVPIRVLKHHNHLTKSKTRPKDNTFDQTQLTRHPKVLSSDQVIPTTFRPVNNDNINTPTDSGHSETTLVHDYDRNSKQDDDNKFNKGLSPHITDSLGISSNHGTGPGQQDRVLFHMVGHDGPMSYKWGFDTGKGHNRQFRFEERDKEGVVKGHFGYYDNEGKFRMMNYNAHPEHGYHMEAAPESEVKE